MAVNGNIVVLQTSFESSQSLTETLLGARYDQGGLEGVLGQRIVTATIKRVDTLSRDKDNVFQLGSYQELSLQERLWGLHPQSFLIDHQSRPVVHLVTQRPMSPPYMSPGIHLIVHGPDDCDNLSGRSMEVRRVQIIVIGGDAGEISNSIGNRQTAAKHSGDLKTGVLLLKAVFLSESAIFLSGNAAGVGGVSGMFHPDRSNQPESKGLAANFDVSIGNYANNENSVSGQLDFPPREKQNEKSVVFTQQNTYVSKANGIHLSDQMKPGGPIDSPNIRYEQKNGEIPPVKIDRGSEGNKSDSGNKTNLNRTIPVASNQGVALLSQQPRILAVSLMVPVQVPLALETGQKLPTIILPNVGNPAGHRSERRKSRKEREEEERKEKEGDGCSYLFDDDYSEPLDNE